MKIYSFNRQSALLLFIYFHSLFNFVLIFLNWIFGKGENLEWALRNVFNLCNSWVTAWCSVYGDTECVYPRDRISLQQQQRLSASPRLLAAPPQPRGQCDWKLHTVIILSFFLLLQSFLRVSFDQTTQTAKLLPYIWGWYLVWSTSWPSTWGRWRRQWRGTPSCECSCVKPNANLLKETLDICNH